MTEHRGTSFYNSCVKVPVHPCSRQPTPSYERYESNGDSTVNTLYKNGKINIAKNEQLFNEAEPSNSTEIVDNFLEFFESIPDYDQVHHLSNEQFKQKVEYLKRRQKFLLTSLQKSLAAHDNVYVSKFSVPKSNERSKNRNVLALNGKKCYLEDSRITSPVPFLSSKHDSLRIDQHLATNRKDKKDETVFERTICLLNGNCNTLDKSNSDNDDMESDIDSIETKSLPASNTKEWQPTVPKPFSFTLREKARKYMTHDETKEERHKSIGNNKRSPYRQRRVKPMPITSKIPLYDKLLAEKEERSRIIREESALNLMSQVRPFKLECDRRAWRSFARSSPEIRSKSISIGTKFKAKPVPKNLFSTEVYDRMLEDEYYRQLQKKIRAAQLMKSSSLPPSMARRERVRSAYTRLKNSTVKNCNNDTENKNAVRLSNNTSIPLERSKSMMSLLPLRGNNLAAILRCQMSREKLERDIREKMEEKRREQATKIRESLIGRNPVWRALRSAARFEHERDLSIRTTLRRDEAREQAERHRMQMEVMLDRVTQIPTLFERHSQSYQLLSRTPQKGSGSKRTQRKKKRKEHGPISSSMVPYMDCENVSRSDSGSATSSPSTLLSTSQSSKSSNISSSQMSEKSVIECRASCSRKKGDRGQLKVSINETAELIEDQNEGDELRANESLISINNGNCALRFDEHDAER